LQRLQPGAQNHKANGFAVGPRVRSIVPPPISENPLPLDSGTEEDTSLTLVVEVALFVLVELQLARDTTPRRTDTINFFIRITVLKVTL
jgi:hypothetical protein